MFKTDLPEWFSNAPTLSVYNSLQPHKSTLSHVTEVPFRKGYSAIHSAHRILQAGQNIFQSQELGHLPILEQMLTQTDIDGANKEELEKYLADCTKALSSGVPFPPAPDNFVNTHGELKSSLNRLAARFLTVSQKLDEVSSSFSKLAKKRKAETDDDLSHVGPAYSQTTTSSPKRSRSEHPE